MRSVEDSRAGAVAVFLGAVRDNSEAGSVVAIEYEAYEPMAEKMLAHTEGEVRRKWPAATGVEMVHRLGTLSVGEVSVAIVVSSPHRAEAFEACRYAIEEIKRDAPIWKRERLAGGKGVWVEGNPLGQGAVAKGASRRASARSLPARKRRAAGQASLREST